MSKKSRKKHKKKPELYPRSSGREEILSPTEERNAIRQRKRNNIVLFLAPAMFILVLIVVAAFFLLAKPENKIKRDGQLNVLLITLDTTRADHIGAYGYGRARTPNLDLLARQGVMFANAYCSTPLTKPSHCSILTGTYPVYHKVHNNANDYLDPANVTLAEILKPKGFKTSAFVSAFTVDSRFGFDQGFDVYDDQYKKDEMIKNFRSERTAEEVFDPFSEWLEANGQQRFFSWVHFYDPHAPYEPPSPYKEEFADSLYDGEIAYMDEYVGQVFQKLKEKNILDKTFIVIAGDHGEAFGEKLEMGHGLFIYDATMKVPFIFYGEKFLPQGMVIQEKVGLNDIVPSILDLLKISPPKKIQGRSLLPWLEGKKREEIPLYIESYCPRETYHWSELIGIIDEGWKYIQAPKPELYNLAEDPREDTNLIDKDVNRVSRLKETLRDSIKEYSSAIEPKKRTLTREEEERLRSLGYVGGGEISGENLPDPKDKMDEFKLIFRAKNAEMRGNNEEAIQRYRELIALAPDLPWTYVDLAMILARTKRMPEAIQVLEQAAEKIPDALGVLAPLGHFYMQVGRFEDAYNVSQRMLKLDAHYFDALTIAGWIYDLEGKWQESSRYFKKALEVEPENTIVRIKYAYSLGALGKFKEALDIYNKLKEESPADFKIYADIGIIYTAMGNLDLARENLKKAVDLNPSPETYLSYSAILERVGDLKEAVRYLKLYLETTSEGDTPRKQNAQSALSQWERRIR